MPPPWWTPVWTRPRNLYLATHFGITGFPISTASSRRYQVTKTAPFDVLRSDRQTYCTSTSPNARAINGPFQRANPLGGGNGSRCIGIGGEIYPVSYRNCCVAVLGHDGEIIAAANVFPADTLKEDNYVLLGSERRSHIRPMLELQDWGSMYLNSLAVSEAYRGSGIGAKLLSWAEASAKNLDVGEGPSLCENAKTLNRGRTSYSFKIALGAQTVSPFNFETVAEHIILVALRVFEFSHSLGQKDTPPLATAIRRLVELGLRAKK